MRPLSLSEERDQLKEEVRQLRGVISGLARDATLCTSIVLRGVQATVYNSLSQYGKVSKERMADLANITHDGTWEPTEMRKFISKLRRKMPEDEDIVTIRGWGWELVRGHGGDTACGSFHSL